MLLRFLHIPKTAGSTFASILSRQYRGKAIFTFSGDISSDIDRFRNLSDSETTSIELFTGHAPILTGLREVDGAPIITLLRHPIDRVKSFCQHVSEGKSPYIRSEFPPETFSLDKFLDSGNPELANLQTKMLINYGSCDSPALLASMAPSESRDMALANLYGRVSCFGLTEFFDESLVIFSESFRWSLPVYVSANRKDEAKLIEFKERHIGRITELNAIDIEVYDAAQVKFREITESVAFNRRRLRFLRLVNAFVPLGIKIRSQVKG